ncbi:MAG: 6-phosphogluconolactonase [Chloroflexi bacterium]|nr:6-phosphogluconolactonase [Chloroflexota bacterium]
MRVEILAESRDVSVAAADAFLDAARDARREGRPLAWVLSGGTTPLGAYALIAEQADALDWSAIDVFFGDERCVPPDHTDSNFGAANGVLLKRIAGLGARVHRIRGEINPVDAAAEYDRLVRDFAATRQSPVFDLVFLGMGGDGHTASLFPDSIAIRENEMWAIPAHSAALDSWRVTMTPAALSEARQVVFLVTGSGKADALVHTLEGPRDINRFPAQAIAPRNGNVRWIVDSYAASKLRGTYQSLT